MGRALRNYQDYLRLARADRCLLAAALLYGSAVTAGLLTPAAPPLWVAIATLAGYLGLVTSGAAVAWALAMPTWQWAVACMLLSPCGCGGGLGFLLLHASAVVELGGRPSAWLLGVGERHVARFCRSCRCGYDLTGNTSGCCPECGARVPGRRLSPARRSNRASTSVGGTVRRLSGRASPARPAPRPPARGRKPRGRP